MKNPNFKRIVLFALIINCLVLYSNGQDNESKKSVFITGITYDSKTQEPLSNTNFRINNKDSYVSNGSGRFSFMGNLGDSVVFTYIGYHPNRLVVPDTLKSDEYVMGVFMHEEPVKLSEVIILARIPTNSIIITPVQTDEKAKEIAQNNIDKAVVESLTKSVKVYDADMNAKKTMRANQMRMENKGMLATPENSVVISTQNLRTNNIIYGSPVYTQGRVKKGAITNNESTVLLRHFKALKRAVLDNPTQ